jgi:hypothetical protein
LPGGLYGDGERFRDKPFLAGGKKALRRKPLPHKDLGNGLRSPPFAPGKTQEKRFFRSAATGWRVLESRH